MVNILIAYGWGSYHPSVFLLVDLKKHSLTPSLSLALSFSQLRTRFEFLIILFWIPQPALLCSFSFVLCSFSKTRAQGIPDSVLLNFSLSFLWFVLFFLFWGTITDQSTASLKTPAFILISHPLSLSLFNRREDLSEQVKVIKSSYEATALFCKKPLLGKAVCPQVLSFGVKRAPEQFPQLNWSLNTSLQQLLLLPLFSFKGAALKSKTTGKRDA